MVLDKEKVNTILSIAIGTIVGTCVATFISCNSPNAVDEPCVYPVEMEAENTDYEVSVVDRHEIGYPIASCRYESKETE